MTASIDFLPVWKRGSTAAERLAELSQIAQKYPERFEQFVICYRESLPNGRWKFRTFEHNCQLIEALGLYDMGKIELVRDTER